MLRQGRCLTAPREDEISVRSVCVCEATSDHGPVGAELGNTDSVCADTRVIRSAAFRQDFQMIPECIRKSTGAKTRGLRRKPGGEGCSGGGDVLSKQTWPPSSMAENYMKLFSCQGM